MQVRLHLKYLKHRYNIQYVGPTPHQVHIYGEGIAPTGMLLLLLLIRPTSLCPVNITGLQQLTVVKTEAAHLSMDVAILTIIIGSTVGGVRVDKVFQRTSSTPLTKFV